MNYLKKLEQEVILKNRCFGCGLCIVPFLKEEATMEILDDVPLPKFKDQIELKLDKDIFNACPGIGINYMDLYNEYYGSPPNNWYTGIADKFGIGYSLDNDLRNKCSSGGVLTEVLIYLLEKKLIDAAILVKQGLPNPRYASYYFARNRKDIMECAQSVYTPVSNLDSMREFKSNEKYAITCLPEQSASIRYLQLRGHKQSLQIKYILGPYTGTSLKHSAIDALLRLYKIPKHDKIKEIKWRDGNWPGSLNITFNSGNKINSKKIYYNFLTPFYISRTSLQSQDFVNEFADISVGDAWSPEFEKKEEGVSVVISRNKEMSLIIEEMIKLEKITLKNVNKTEILNMHGHMNDFKKRGSYIRLKMRSLFNIASPNNGLRPDSILISRVFVEIVIVLIFKLCSNSFSRKIMEFIPVAWLGFIFNKARLAWKELSKPVKRSNLSSLKMIRNNKK